MKASKIVSSHQYLWLILWIVLLLAVGFGLGQMTMNDVGTWYKTLNRSSLTPPDQVFGIAWSILYILIAISGWMIWCANEFKELAAIKTMFISQMLLNWCWSPLFFGLHLIGTSLVVILLMVILVSLIVFKCRKNLFPVTALLAPYLIWISFASYLNLYIFVNN